MDISLHFLRTEIIIIIVLYGISDVYLPVILCVQ